MKLVLLAATSFAVPACSNNVTTGGGDDDTNPMGDQWDQALKARQTDYNAALKIAALRLTGDLPTMTEINQIALAADDAAKKTAYESLIQQYMARPAFANQIFRFWRDTFKMGETPMLDTAPALAAKISVENGSYMDLFTLNSNNCPSFDGTTFTPAACANGGPVAGVLTNPGVHSLFTSNLAFRRTRWVQEIFDCLKFPAEVSPTGTEVGGPSLYTGVWPFTSIAGTTNGGRINFLDVSAVICANCHTTINHIAPLFANYDANGVYQTSIQVTTPLDGAPLAMMSDYLPTGETTAWRYQKPAADIPALGVQMAADPDVAKCGVARIWNWALGKTDIVETLQEVPIETIQTQLDAFTASGFKMKDLIYAVFTHEDFVKF
jgi:hypothetical protein